MSKIIHALQGFASNSGDLPALRGDNSAFSYSGMLAAVHMLADELTTLGIERVGLAADNGPEWIIVDLACQLAGVPLIPLPGFFTPQQMRHAVESSGVDALLSDRDGFASTCATLFGARLSGGAVTFASLTSISAFRLCPLLDSFLLPDNTAKITYTSGSTGHPKGVCLSVAAQYATASALNDALKDTPLHRHLAVLPLATLLENVAGVYSALLRGAEVMLPSLATLGWAGSSGLDIQALESTLTAAKPDSAVLLPQILKGLISARESGKWPAPASLKFLAVGGARVAPDLIKRGRQLGLPVYEGYGLSECGSVVSVNRPGADKLGSAGKVLTHCVVHTARSELVVGGNVYQGYLQKEHCVPVPTEVATGDLGEIDDDGFLWLHGRSKNVLVNSYGRNISPEWPESELLAQPSILQCMVIGDDQAYCSALIYPSPHASHEQIDHEISMCNSVLPDYAQIKRWVQLPVPLSAENDLLTANGRLRRHEILMHYSGLADTCYCDYPELIRSTNSADVTVAKE
ncbi:AMP-binding protein [Zhongshania aliphaticivorans]|uniref:AMP-binding protein n=1 Tax=Zhongshania aliphaticivorans TaxID=1470434 RepID=UPI0012E436F4|nr:AMP-binding protein [Zhongshania aliphaticivorans]CAA0117939.1 Long-chain-fatty-acid--CoA ligase FadD15 [Zhongshania aliphaticivorans]